MKFGEYVKQLRLQKDDLSQQKLADETGVKRSYISKIESDSVSPPSEEVLIVLAKALGEDPYRFILHAGKIPSAFAKVILENEDIFEMIRSRITHGGSNYEAKS